MDKTLQLLAEAIDHCMLVDRHSLRRNLKTLRKRLADNKPGDRMQAELARRIAQSQALVEQRSVCPSLNFPDLPVSEKRADIAAAIRDHQVVIVAGETGSGKTTQLPKICLQLERGIVGTIGHTQPRRLAARSVAHRIADELNSPLGEVVGYQVRFTDKVSEQTRVKLMTDGILLAEIQKDPYLNRYDTLIIDEAHERSLNIDFLLGYLKQLLPKRPDFKLIVTSATIDVQRFSAHFDNAPVIEVSGRTYPVETRYRPLQELGEGIDLATGIAAAVEELMAGEQSSTPGDVLVFLSGEGDIREVARHMRTLQRDDRRWQRTEVLPLYARLSNAEQNKVFQLGSARGRRIVLATNVAETSLTVPGIRYVIDPGYARISRYSFRTKVQRLPIEPISQASANQRKGRCGRTAEGICIRLYDESDFNQRPEFTDPEIQRTNLASVILQMLTLRMGDIEDFPFVDPPDRRMISDGFKLLEELGAVDAKRRLTEIGRAISQFQVDPRLARMLVAARQQNCLFEMLIIASALSVQDPRERPADKQQASDEKHRRFAHSDSDFLSFVNLWNYYEEQRQLLSRNQLRQRLQREFLSPLRMQEWRDVHHQLRLMCKQQGYPLNADPANYETVHRAILAGLLSHIANLDEHREYLGARNRRLRLFPGSALFKKQPKWIVAAEITETSQVYARCNALIQPEWLMGINDPLFKHHYYEPRWQQKSGRVMAYERLSLYGLVISDQKSVHYGPVDPVVSRELLIRGALVEGKVSERHPTASAAFFKHNRAVIREIEAMEAKSRRQDILVDDQRFFEFFDERVAADVITLKHFEAWRKQVEVKQPQLLFVDKEYLMQHGASHVNEAQFPTKLRCGDLVFRLSYRFEPGHRADGVTAKIPIGLLNRAPQHRFDWLVPGMLRDKCIALIKNLPKQLRKQMVPVPDYVDKILAELRPDDSPLLEALSRTLKSTARVDIPLDAWQPQLLDDFFRMNFSVVDGGGQVLGQGRDLHALQQQFQGLMTESLQQQTRQTFTPASGSASSITQWDFGALPREYQFKQAGVTVTSYPALVDNRESVAIELVDFPEQAERQTRRGLVRLLMLQMPQQVKQLRKQLLSGNQLHLQFAALGQRRESWVEDLISALFERVFLAQDDTLPRDEAAFKQCFDAGRGRLMDEAAAMETLATEIIGLYSDIRRQLKRANELAWAQAIADIQQQLQMLFKQGFILDTPWQQLQEFPRYLQAILQRLDKLRGHFQRDRQLLIGLQGLSAPLQEHWTSNSEAAARSPDLLQFRWLLEEYRVSLFAQTLGTRQPVSEKRLKLLWQQVRESLLDLRS